MLRAIDFFVCLLLGFGFILGLFFCFSLKMGKRQLSPNSKCHMDLEICVDHRQVFVSGMATFQIQEGRETQQGTTPSHGREGAAGQGEGQLIQPPLPPLTSFIGQMADRRRRWVG